VTVEEKLVPAVNPKRSVTPGHLIPLEDGRRYKTLTLPLRGLGLTPIEYRAKWGLAPDYPTTAPSYSARRSELAKSLGLGQARRKANAPAGGQQRLSPQHPSAAAREASTPEA
jgi:predicted transcriptional regulator